MITEYNWPRSAAGGAGEQTDRAERKRDPAPQADDKKKTPTQPQQGDGSTPSREQQQQATIIRDWASI